MPAQPTLRLRPFVPAMLAGFGLAGFAAGPAQAQSVAGFSCATGALVSSASNNTDVRPIPRILRYAVAAGTDTAPVGALRENREVTVTGGDAEHGWVRVDVQFDSAIPRDCRLPLTLTVASDQGNPADRASQEQLARVLDGLQLTTFGSEVMDHLAGAMAFAGNGTDSASFRIPIRATTAPRNSAHPLKLVLARNYAAALPFTVTVAPLPPFTLVAPSAPVAAGTATPLRAEHPVALLPGTAAMPVSFRLSSQALGRWQSAPGASPTETLGTWNDRFTPLRAEAVLIPAAPAQPLSGTVTVSFAGRSQTLPIALAARPAASAPTCDPVFAVVAVKGGLRVSMNNRSTGPCPSYRVKPRAFGKTLAPLSPPQAKLALPAGLKPSGPLLSPGGAGAEGSVTFTLDKTVLARLKPVTRFEFDIIAEGATLPNAPRGASITLSAADIAVMTIK